MESILGVSQTDDWDEVKSEPDVVRPDLILSNRGFLMFAHEKYEIAQKYFRILSETEPKSPHAINNLALAYLYDGDVGKGAKVIESYFGNNAKVGTQHAQLMTNLRSLYDLTDSSNLRKKAILKHIIPEVGDDFDSTFIKI